MFIIQAPYPALAVTSYLPNPQLGDSINSTGSIEVRRALDGTKYIYVKSRDSRKKLLWNFNLSQMKALELREIWEAYNSSQIKVTDHIGKVYIRYFTTNPFEFEAVGRSVGSPGLDTRVQIQVEFEGTEQ